MKTNIKAKIKGHNDVFIDWPFYKFFFHFYSNSEMQISHCVWHFPSLFVCLDRESCSAAIIESILGISTTLGNNLGC